MSIFDAYPKITFVGPHADVATVGYRYYEAERMILGKTMKAHLRIALCYWHTFCWNGFDIFGEGTLDHDWLSVQDPMKAAFTKADAAFSLMQTLGLGYFTFHDRDIAPEGDNLRTFQSNLAKVGEYIASKMQETGIELLWGTANLFSHRRYMAGAATNPNPEIFAYAAAQVRNAIELTHQLSGHNYVLWGGREGYDSLLNTNMCQEIDQLGRFLCLLAEHKHKIGFKGTLLIEPKPCEPTKHQYDFDTATVYAFLQKYGLEKEYKVNIEGNHATLAGHSFAHEVAYAFANGIFGSIDANQGDPQLGWDTDQFPLSPMEITQVMYIILKQGGFTTGGFNFDTKLRRQSITLNDYLDAYIGGIDSLAHALLVAADLIEQDTIDAAVRQRYASWKNVLGQKILDGSLDFSEIADAGLVLKTEPKIVSGNQEQLENIMMYSILNAKA